MAGLTFRLGQLPDALQTDASNNIGIGGSPSGSYKLEVTGTAKVSSTLLVSGASTLTGNVGIGANLLSWYSGGYTALQIGGMAGILSNISNTSTTGSLTMGYNIYVDSAGNYQYMNTTSARAGSIMVMEGGNISFQNAVAATSANPTLTTRFTIASTGAATFTSNETNPLTLYSTTTSGEGHKIQWQGNYLSNLIVADIRGNGSGAGGAFIIRTADTSSVLQTRLTITNVGKVTIPSGAYGLSYFSMNYTNANAGSREWAIGSDTAGWGSFSIGQATTQGGSTFSDKIVISSGGKVTINTPTAGTALYVNGLAGEWCGEFSNTSSSSSYGVFIAAGSGSGTQSLNVSNYNGSTTYFKVRGDGFINVGTFTYNNSVSGRPMLVESGGGLGYNASTRESKKNIETINNISWIAKLNPVSFNKRKKGEDGNYSEEVYEEVDYGFIADEVEKINSDFVFYNNKEDGIKELAGVKYESMTAILVKAIQELSAQNQDLKSRLDKAGL